MISPKEVEHVASLARIKLSKKDVESLVKEFDAILAYVDQLKKVKVPAAAEARIGAIKNVLREDLASPISEDDRQRLLKEAPERVGDFIAVKKIIAQD